MHLHPLNKNCKQLTPVERVKIARHKDRPRGLDVILAITTSFQELHGDRNFSDDPAVICGVGEVGGIRCACIVQEKGCEGKERQEHRFGMMSPSGYRKALRVMKLAERFSLPIFTIIDTPGAHPSLEAEKQGQSRAIADNLFQMSDLKTPIISLILGEGGSGGALGICVSDYILMLEHSYFSVISPEGCASILWKDARKADLSAEQLKMQSEHLLEFGMIDKIIYEGGEGFHQNKEEVLSSISIEVESALSYFSALQMDELLTKRRNKYRCF